MEWNPSFATSGWVVLDKSRNISMPQFPQLESGENGPELSVVVRIK